MQSFEKLIEEVEAAKIDMAKSEKGNKTASVRVRKRMQKLKKLAQEVRMEILDTRKD